MRRPRPRGMFTGQPPSPRRSFLGFVKKFFNDWSTDFSSLLAYNFVIALLPIAVAAFGIFGLVIRSNPSAKQSIIDSIVNSVDDNNTKTAARQVESRRSPSLCQLHVTHSRSRTSLRINSQAILEPSLPSALSLPCTAALDCSWPWRKY